MTSTWFTSDLHFGHCRILTFNAHTRPFVSVEEMDQHLIMQWQAVVQPQDHIWVLGDLFFCNAARALQILDQLPGIIRVCLGNHDNVIRNNSSVRSRFASVCDYKEIKISGRDIVMFHFPIAEFNKMHYGAWHLYGHCHGKFTHPGKAVDVGWDGPLGGKLISPSDIAEYMAPRPILTHHGNGLPNEKIISHTLESEK